MIYNTEFLSLNYKEMCNISKNVRSEDLKADWVCSIITENRSTDSEPKRGIFF